MKSIRQKRVDMMTLKLSPEEGFLLSRIEGTTTMKELAALTGFDEAHVAGIVERLHQQGAIEDADEGGSPAAPVQADADEPSDDVVVEDDGAADAESADEGAEAEDPAAALAERESEIEYRKIYESVYHPMPKDARVSVAATAAGPHLMALCLDADPQIIVAVLGNAQVGLQHARYIAQHHRTQIGLEAVAKRTEFLGDSFFQRRLLRNPQLPVTILARILNPKMMMEVYKVAIDREVPERTRLLTRETLRKKFMTSSSDERAALLIRTEGRCLLHLTACTLDAHATQILCGRPNFTTMFVQNLARWSATPPMLLTALLKNPVVRRNIGLRKMLLRHPNTPSDAKRNLA